MDPSQIISNVPLSRQTKFLSRSISPTHTLFISQSLLLAHVLIGICIYFTYLHWVFFHLLVYSSLNSVNNFTVCPYILLPHSFKRFFCLLVRITIMCFYFDPDTLPCSHPKALILLVILDFFCFLSLIHLCAFVLYLVTSDSSIPRISLRNFWKSLPWNWLVK